MRHPQTKAMLAYWMELFHDAQADAPADPLAERPTLPQRNAVEPGAIRTLLGDTFILDRMDGEARYRIAGSRLCALHGGELAARPFHETFVGPQRGAASSWARTFGRDTCLVLVSSLATSRHGETVALETLLMPLRHEGRNDCRALGITTPAAGAEWIGMVPVTAQEVLGVRLIRPWEDDAFRANHPFQLPKPLSIVPPAAAERRVAHLTVIEGGRR